MREIIERWHYDNHPDSFRFCSNGLCKEIREHVEEPDKNLSYVADDIDEFISTAVQPSQQTLKEWSDRLSAVVWP